MLVRLLLHGNRQMGGHLMLVFCPFAYLLLLFYVMTVAVSVGHMVFEGVGVLEEENDACRSVA